VRRSEGRLLWSRLPVRSPILSPSRRPEDDTMRTIIASSTALLIVFAAAAAQRPPRRRTPSSIARNRVSAAWSRLHPGRSRSGSPRNLELAFSTVEVQDSGGAGVDQGKPRIDPAHPSVMRVAVRPLPPEPTRCTGACCRSTPTRPRGELQLPRRVAVKAAACASRPAEHRRGRSARDRGRGLLPQRRALLRAQAPHGRGRQGCAALQWPAHRRACHVP
jgi:hypothetical protein